MHNIGDLPLFPHPHPSPITLSPLTVRWFLFRLIFKNIRYIYYVSDQVQMIS